MLWFSSVKFKLLLKTAQLNINFLKIQDFHFMTLCKPSVSFAPVNPVQWPKNWKSSFPLVTANYDYFSSLLNIILTVVTLYHTPYLKWSLVTCRQAVHLINVFKTTQQSTCWKGLEMTHQIFSFSSAMWRALLCTFCFDVYPVSTCLLLLFRSTANSGKLNNFFNHHCHARWLT